MKLLDLHPDVANFLNSPQGLRVGHDRIEKSALLDVRDPSFDTSIGQISMGTAADIDLAVAAAREALSGPWGHMSAHDRGQLLWKLADAIEDHKQIFGELDAIDNGKPMHVARDVDAVYSARHFRYFAGWPSKIEGRTIPVSSPGKMNFTLVEPVGVCGLITPWNYPTLMVAWKLAPALAAGNTIVLKPAEQTPLSALYLADLALKVGFPPGVLNVVPGLGRDAGAALASHPGVDKVGFTGSTETRSPDCRSLGWKPQESFFGTWRESCKHLVRGCRLGQGHCGIILGAVWQQWSILYSWRTTVCSSLHQGSSR